MSADQSPVRVTVKRLGPYVIEGPVVICDRDGNPIEPPPAKVPGQVKLCSCGDSKNWPFCDGSHKLKKESGTVGGQS